MLVLFVLFFRIVVKGEYYEYLLDPCNGVVCPDARNTTGVAFCQKADQYYNCGLIKEPIWLFNYNFQQIQFTVQYPGGTDWRYMCVHTACVKDYKVKADDAILSIMTNPMQHVFE